MRLAALVVVAVSACSSSPASFLESGGGKWVVHPEVLPARPEALRLALPDGTHREAQRVRMAQSELGLTWAGKFDDGEVLLLARAEGGVTGLLEVGGRRWELAGLDGQPVTLREHQAQAFQNCEAPEAAPGIAAKQAEVPESGPKPGLGKVTTIDVAALYTDSLLADEQATRGFIDTSVAIANDVFQQNNLNVRYRLVHKGPLTGVQPPDGGVVTVGGVTYEQSEVTAMDWLNTEPREVVELRAATGADMVALFIPMPAGTPRACGVANIALAGDLNQRDGLPFNQRAYSVHRVGCGLGDFTFTHELGHNYGLLHNRADHDRLVNQGTPPRQPYAAGATFADSSSKLGQSATVMDCVGGGFASASAVCNRRPLFSSPATVVDGQPIGDGTRDNRRLLAEEAPGYSAFRAPAPSQMPQVRITSPARNATVQGVVTLTATASDPEEGNLDARLRWYDDLGAFLGQGPVVLATLTAGDRVITARATDSSGVEGQWSVRVRVVMPPPIVAGFTVACSQLTCTFDPSASTGSGALTFLWTFPVDVTLPLGPTPTITFPSSGTYFVTLRVRDALGREASTTRGVTVTGPVVVSPRAGAWFNPARSGHGVELFPVAGGSWVFVWYTYTPWGAPIWYLADVAPLSNNTFASTLYLTTWNGAGTDRTPIGSVSLTFSSATTAQLAYTVNGVSGSEPIQHLAGGEGRSGAWYEPALSGWGLQLEEQPGFYGATIAFYEGSQPRWVMGTALPGPAVGMALSWYDGPGLCPGCTYAGSPTPTPAGTLDLHVGEGAFSGYANTLITTPSGWTWNRPWASIAKLTQ
ncbi:MAG: PKD domain-containing protein [Myxococcota bacterium]